MNINLSIAITFFYKYSRLEYLRQICEAHRQMDIEYTTYIVTNTNDEHEINLIRENAYSKDLRIITPTYLGHPFLLTWSHRDIFREQISQESDHTHFLYTEDDLLLTKKNLDYWLSARNITKSTPFIPGFFRYEINAEGEAVSTDIIKRQSLASHLLKFEETTFVNLKQPYQGMYLMDKQLATEFLFSNASSPNTGQWGIREKAAQGLTFWRVPRGFHSRSIVGLNHNMQIHSDARIHHLPNNYANNPNSRFGRIPVDRLFKNPPPNPLQQNPPETSHVNFPSQSSSSSQKNSF